MNIFFGFDLREKNIKIMRADKTIESAQTDLLPFVSRPFSEEFFAEAQTLLGEYFKAKPLTQGATGYVVLPNEYVGFEIFNLPNVGPVKSWQALEAEFTNLYAGKQKDKKINRFIISKNKQYMTIGAQYFDKALMGNLYKLLTEFKIVPKDTTSSGESLIHTVYALAPKLRGKSFIFADMHENYTEIAVSSKGKPMGAVCVPYGTALLESDKVEQEYMLVDHTAGELAVINAREIARARALTTAELDDEELVKLSEQAAEDNESLSDENPEGVEGAGGINGGAGSSATKDIDAASRFFDDKSDDEDDENEAMAEAAATDSTAIISEVELSEDGATVAEGFEDVRKPNKIKVFRKTPRKYPKFMLREQPQTEEGITFENFRIIAKWLLLYARSAQLAEYINDPEYILVNMPEDKRYLLDMINGERGDGLEFRAFNAADKLPEMLRENLDLPGSKNARQRGFGKNG